MQKCWKVRQRRTNEAQKQPNFGLWATKRGIFSVRYMDLHFRWFIVLYSRLWASIALFCLTFHHRSRNGIAWIRTSVTRSQKFGEKRLNFAKIEFRWLEICSLGNFFAQIFFPRVVDYLGWANFFSSKQNPLKLLLNGTLEIAGKV